MPRVARVEVSTVEDVAIRCRAGCTAGLILDVEPLLAPWNCPDGEYSQRIDDACRYLRTVVPSLRHLAVATNASRRYRPTPGAVAVRFIGRAGKPWGTSWARRIDRPLAVAGDTVLTDGLLAYRLDATFLHVRPTVPVPLWPRAQRWSGFAVHRLFVDGPRADRRG